MIKKGQILVIWSKTPLKGACPFKKEEQEQVQGGGRHLHWQCLMRSSQLSTSCGSSAMRACAAEIRSGLIAILAFSSLSSKPLLLLMNLSL